MLQYIILIALLLVITLFVYQKLTCGICKSSVHLVGKVVIVTGGNSGIGLQTALNLAERGARVILACRDESRGLAAQRHITEITGNKDVHYRYLDLASLTSVRDFAKQILNEESRLDVLVNNAGAGGLGNFKTEDDLHIGMQVNYFGPFLLTCLLLPILKISESSRIVNVSSMAYKYGEVDFENLNMEKKWNDYSVYFNSKLCMNLMTLELSRRLQDTKVTVNCLHPGVAATNIFRHIPSETIKNVVKSFISIIFQSEWEAAQTSIYLSVSSDVANVSGCYFVNCHKAQPSRQSTDIILAKKLWLETETLVKFSL